ncbi:MAG: PAS domain S-box protein [Candidatus Eisenbacteria bacterium]
MKINTKLLLAFLLIALIPLGIISILFYFNAEDVLTRGALSHLESVAAIQRTRVESIVEQNLERLNLVSSRTQLRLSLDSFIRNPNAVDRDKINQILLDARSSVSSFQDISVLTLDGKVIASTGAAKIGSAHSNDEVFIRGQAENTADVLFLNENHSLGVYLSGPLSLEGKLLGVVVIECLADNIVSSVTDYAGLGATGETLLARKNENGDALFLTPTRFDKNAALSRTVLKEELDSPTIQALLKNEKLFTDTVDYRGEPVLAATEYIAKTGWGLVTKTDKAEALAPVTRLQNASFTIVLLSLALVLLVSLFLARTITRPIVRLAHMATRVSEGDLATRAEVTSRDEIGILARACNQMKDSLFTANSELERALDERRQAEEKYSTLVEKGNDGIIIIQDGLVRFANSRMVEMTGFSLDEAIGRPFIDFVVPEYRKSVVEHYQRRISGQKVPNNYEIEILAKDGRRIPVEINANTIEFEGRPADMAIVRDITERKLADKETRELQEYLQLQIKRMPIGLIVWDTEFRVQTWNPAAEKIFGFTAGEAAGKHPYDIIVPKEAQPDVDNIWRRLLEGDETAHSANENTTRDGRTILCEWTNTPLKKADGTLVGVLSMVQDITERKQAEDALRQSEERYRDLFDNANDLIQSVTPDGRLLYVNKAWRKALGYSQEEIGKLKMRDIIHPDSMNHCMETFQKVMSGQPVKNIEAVFVAKDGSVINVEGNAHCRFADGKPVSTQGIFRDVTDRKRAEERIIHLNSVLRALRDINQLITRESSDRERLIRESCDILVGARGYEKAWILLVDEDRNPVSVAAAGLGDESSVFLEQMRSGKYPKCVKELWTKDNPFLAYDRPGSRHKGCILAGIHRSRGVYRCKLEYGDKVYGMLGVTIQSDMVADQEEQGLFLELCGDISYALAAIEREEDRRRLDQELRESGASLLQAQQIAHLGSWDWDVVKNETSYSDELHRIFGRHVQNFEAFIDAVHPDDRESVEKSVHEALWENKPYDIEYRIVLPDDSERAVRAQAEVTLDNNGRPIRIIGTVHDITERKKMEEQLVTTDRLASIGELASGIAHELNNPLTGVIGLSQLILDKKGVSGEIKEDLEMVNSEAQRAARVVKGLLTFARKHPAAKQPENVNILIEKVLELRAYEQKVSNIEVQTHFAPDLPEVMADYFQLQQVFLTIIINAEHFMTEAHHKGTLTITTKSVGGMLRASFADDGPGISEEHMRTLFNPFFTTKEVGKGTGLGLSICHGIVADHGGKIYAESKPGKGATFIVELPVAS